MLDIWNFIRLEEKFKIIYFLVLWLDVRLDFDIDIFGLWALNVQVLAVLVTRYEVDSWLFLERFHKLDDSPLQMMQILFYSKFS